MKIRRRLKKMRIIAKRMRMMKITMIMKKEIITTEVGAEAVLSLYVNTRGQGSTNTNFTYLI